MRRTFKTLYCIIIIIDGTLKHVYSLRSKYNDDDNFESLHRIFESCTPDNIVFIGFWTSRDLLNVTKSDQILRKKTDQKISAFGRN